MPAQKPVRFPPARRLISTPKTPQQDFAQAYRAFTMRHVHDEPFAKRLHHLENVGVRATGRMLRARARERLAAFVLVAGFNPKQIVDIYSFGTTPEVIDVFEVLWPSLPPQ